MTSPADQHRSHGARPVGCAVITVSDTRTPQTDRGGPLVAQHLRQAGHSIRAQEIVPDDVEQIQRLIKALLKPGNVEAILMTGGTGISARDQTYETVQALLTRELPGYGELLRMLSYEQIGPAAMLSRAIGGLIGTTVILTMPGSPAAVKLAMQRIILPELGHLVQQACQ